MTTSHSEHKEIHKTPEINDNEKPMKPSCWKTFRYGVRNITVEPILSLFIMAAVLNSMTTQNLSIDKACRVTLQYPSDICDSLRAQELENQNEYEREVQKVVAKFITYKTYITATLPSILALFAGSFSDNTGRRKLFLIIPLCGQILLCANNIMNTYYFYELSIEFLFFSEAILEGFSGGWILPMFTVFAYISTITTEKNRTFRMGLLNFSLTAGFPIGMALSGVLLKTLGFYGGYLIAITSHTLNLLYTLIFLRDPPRRPEQLKHDNKGFIYVMKTFFSLDNVKEALRLLFKGPNTRRFRLLTYVLTASMLFGSMHGEISILYLNTRFRFGWDELLFGIFQSYNFIMHTFGTIFAITVFSKILGWHDSVLGIISTASKITSAFIFAFAPNTQIFFLAPIVDIFNGTAMLAMTSIISKYVEFQELGKINSIISLSQNLMPLIYIPTYTTVYKSTMETFPGAIFLLAAALTLPSIIVFIWLFNEHISKNDSTEKQSIKSRDEPNT